MYGLLLILLLFLLPDQSWAAATRNAQNSAETVGAANTIAAFNTAITGTTSNGFVVASMVFATQASSAITVTCGGSAMTEFTGSPGNASTIQTRMYGRIVGAINGNLSCSASWTTNNTAALTISVYEGVEQSAFASAYVSPLSSAIDTGAGSATPTLSVTGGSSGDYTVATLGLDSGRDPSSPLQSEPSGTGLYHSNVQFQAGIGVSSAARAGSNVTHGWTDISSTSYAYLGVNLIQSSAGGGPNTNYFRRRVQ